jgi:hypothetical protein
MNPHNWFERLLDNLADRGLELLEDQLGSETTNGR